MITAPPRLPDGPRRWSVPSLLRAVAERVDASQLADELEMFAMAAQERPQLPIRWTIAPSPASCSPAPLGVIFTAAMHLSGIASDDDSYLSATLGTIDMRGPLLTWRCPART